MLAELSDIVDLPDRAAAVEDLMADDRQLVGAGMVEDKTVVARGVMDCAIKGVLQWDWIQRRLRGGMVLAPAGQRWLFHSARVPLRLPKGTRGMRSHTPPPVRPSAPPFRRSVCLRASRCWRARRQT